MIPHVSDYELLRIIGRGSYGDVWLARGVTGLYRAVKLVWRERFSDLQPYEREFKGLREFAAFSLSESRQLALLHIGRNDAAGFFYYVMELADDVETGREIVPERYVPHTLKEVRERHGRRPAPEVVTLGVDLARALAGLHARGLVHRDVKPSNVIFVGGAPKLADIGLVTAATAAHTFVGTEGFVPPEGPGTPAADVFSLGKLLYETATGLDRHDYPRLPADLHALPDRKELLELNEIIIRACDPSATQRYSDAAALLDDLLLLQAGRSMRRLRAAERRLTRAVRVGAVLALVAGIAGIGAFIERRRAESESTLRRQAETERDDLARRTLYSAGLARAQRSLELDELGRARQQLQEIAPKPGEPDLRGFEWHALWSEAQGDAADVLRAGGPAAEKARYSPDGKWIAVHAADKRLTLWDTATKQIVRTIEDVHRFAGFSSDSQWLVGSNPAFALQRWSVAAGEPDTQPAEGVNRPIAALGTDRALCFTDGVAGATHALRVWDFSRHTEVSRLAIEPDADRTPWDFYRAAVSADGKTCALVLIAGREHQARWKLHVVDLVRHRALHDEYIERPLNLALSSDGVWIALSYDSTLKVTVQELTTSRALWKVLGGTGMGHALAFSPDDSRLVLAGRDQILGVVDARTGNAINELRGHNGGVDDVSWSPDGKTLVSASNGGDVRLWREPGRPSPRTADGFWDSNNNASNLVVSADGNKIAVSRNERQVDILSLDTLAALHSLPRAMSPVGFVDGDAALLSSTFEDTLQHWSLREPPALETESPLFDVAAASHVYLSRNRERIVASNALGQLSIWDQATRRLLHTVSAHRERIWATVVSPKGDLVFTCGGDLRNCVWRTDDGTLVAEWPARPATVDAAFEQRMHILALGLSSGDIELRDEKTLALMRTLRSGSARIVALAFSPDGSRLVAGGPNGAVHVYATNGWREMTTLMATNTAGASNAIVNRLTFTPDGNTLIAYLTNGRLRIWRTQK